MLKIGFDVHGVLDTLPEFLTLAYVMMESPEFEVHVITGLKLIDIQKEIGHLIDLSKVKYFSVVDHLTEKGVEIDWVDGLPWADTKEWDNAKAEYCEREQIDIVFDDSPYYGVTFESINTTYCHVQTTKRKKFDM